MGKIGRFHDDRRYWIKNPRISESIEESRLVTEGRIEDYWGTFVKSNPRFQSDARLRDFIEDQAEINMPGYKYNNKQEIGSFNGDVFEWLLTANGSLSLITETLEIVMGYYDEQYFTRFDGSFWDAYNVNYQDIIFQCLDLTRMELLRRKDSVYICRELTKIFEKQ